MNSHPSAPILTAKRDQPLRIALCGIGLEAYWEQFEGLRFRLEGYLEQLTNSLAQPGIEVVRLGLIDSVGRAREAGRECRRANADLLLLYVTTYALSGIVLPLVQRVGVPVIVLNLQPAAAIDYAALNRFSDRRSMTGQWLAYCAACPVPEIANVFDRAQIPFHQVTGVLAEVQTQREIHEWISAASVFALLRESRLGLLGHYYSGMLDVVTDITQVSITFGCDIEILEVDELSALRPAISEEAVAARLEQIRGHFDVQVDCPSSELARAARTSVALDRFVELHDLQFMAYYYKGSGVEANEDTMSSIILGSSLLTARGIPVAGEYEVKNALAMKILDAFGVGGSFTEYYAVDYHDDVVVMGHDGPGHIAIAEGKTKVRPLEVYHGKVGRGLSVEMSVRHGPVTLFSVVEDRERGFRFLVAEGMCEAGPTLAIGNTNSRYRFSLGAKAFIEKWNAHGPAHHCAIGVGHLASQLGKLASLLEIPIHKAC
jgi:L-arabinose isomerase